MTSERSLSGGSNTGTWGVPGRGDSGETCVPGLWLEQSGQDQGDMRRAIRALGGCEKGGLRADVGLTGSLWLLHPDRLQRPRGRAGPGQKYPGRGNGHTAGATPAATHDFTRVCMWCVREKGQGYIPGCWPWQEKSGAALDRQGRLEEAERAVKVWTH